MCTICATFNFRSIKIVLDKFVYPGVVRFIFCKSRFSYLWNSASKTKSSLTRQNNVWCQDEGTGSKIDFGFSGQITQEAFNLFLIFDFNIVHVYANVTSFKFVLNYDKFSNTEVLNFFFLPEIFVTNYIYSWYFSVY